VQVRPSERYIEEKHTELKISNTTDNAGITQSHVRDTRCRRMQELNSFSIYRWATYLGLCMFVIQGVFDYTEPKPKHNLAHSITIWETGFMDLNDPARQYRLLGVIQYGRGGGRRRWIGKMFQNPSKTAKSCSLSCFCTTTIRAR